MKKRISLLLAIVTVITAMVLVLSFSASAAEDFDPTAPTTEGAYAEIYDANNQFVAALTDVTSGVSTFFAKTKNTDGYSVHIFKEFTMPGEEEIQVFGNTLVDGNGFKIISNRKAGEAAVRVYNSEADGKWGNKDAFEGKIDTVRFKNFNLEVTNAHAFMFYNSAVLQLEAGCNVVIKSTGKIVHSARNGGKVTILGGEYTFAAKDPMNFTSTIKSGDVTYNAWADWEILGGTFRFNGAVTDGSSPWTRIFTIGNGNRNSLTFKNATVVKDAAATGHAAVIGIESSATTEGRLVIESIRFENLHWGAYVNGANNKMTIKGNIVGLNTGTVVNVRTGKITADGATVSTETSGKITVDVGNSGTGNFVAKNNSNITDVLYIRQGSTATLDNSAIAAISAPATKDATTTTTLTMTACTVSGVTNVAAKSNLTIENCNLGQVKTAANSTTTIKNSSIYKASDNALCISGGTVTVTGGTVESTTGGCPVPVDGGATVTFDGVTVKSAGRASFEIRSANANVTIKNCTVSMGSRKDQGAIMLSGKNASATVENTTITANNSPCVYLSAEGAKFTATDCTITAGTIADNKDKPAELSGAIILTGTAASATIEDTVVTAENARCVYLTGEGSAFTMISGIIQQKGSSYAAINSNGEKTVTTVYDGYIICEGTHQAYRGESAKHANLTVYGGHFIVMATNGTTNTYNQDKGVEGFNNGAYYYGGQVYNYQLQGNGKYSYGAAQLVPKSDCTQILNNNSGTKVTSLTGTELYKNKNQLSAKDGAQVRIAADGTNGIRFISDIPKATIDLIAKVIDEGTTVTYGTAIVPTHYLTDNNLKAFSITALENLGVKVLKIPATEKGTTVNADGSLTLSAAVIGMSDAQLKLAYSAMPYAEYTVDGHTVYMCGVYDNVKNTRTIADVAEAAIQDVRAEIGTLDGEYYGTAVVIGGVTYYSCYSETAYAKLQEYAALDGTQDDYAGFEAAVAAGDDAANVNSII